MTDGVKRVVDVSGASDRIVSDSEAKEIIRSRWKDLATKPELSTERRYVMLRGESMRLLVVDYGHQVVLEVYSAGRRATERIIWPVGPDSPDSLMYMAEDWREEILISAVGGVLSLMEGKVYLFA